MNPSDTGESVRFHIPGMACESDVDLIAKAIRAVEAGAAVVFDRGTREVEVHPVERDPEVFRHAIGDAGFCVTR